MFIRKFLNNTIWIWKCLQDVPDWKRCIETKGKTIVDKQTTNNNKFNDLKDYYSNKIFHNVSSNILIAWNKSHNV